MSSEGIMITFSRIQNTRGRRNFIVSLSELDYIGHIVSMEVKEKYETWKLSEAKAKLSQVVREAEDAPQCITVEGKRKVVIVSAEYFEELMPKEKKVSLVELIEQSPLYGTDFPIGEERMEMQVSEPLDLSS